MKRLANSKKLILFVALAILIASIAGGALGEVFGLGFFASPLPVISIAAEPAVHIGSYALSNTTIMFWISGIVLLFLGWRASRNISDVPRGLQNVFEAIFDFFRNMAEEMGGKGAFRFLSVVILLFLIILASNWLGIIPGVGSFGRLETISEWVAEHAEDEVTVLHKMYPAIGEEDIEALATLEVLRTESDERFTVFNDGTLALIPFGRGERSKAPLSSIVPVDSVTLEELEEQIKLGGLGSLSTGAYREWENIEKYIEAGVVQQPYTDASGQYYGCDASKISSSETCDKKQTAGVLIPFLRGASTDINTTLTFALFAMASVQIFGITSLGFFGYVGKFLNFKQGPLGLYVGILEFFAEIARTISFTFRLFGNLFAGEILLIAIGFLLPLIGIIPFLGLELFVGVIQAFIFATLTLVFSVLAVKPHGGHDKH